MSQRRGKIFFRGGILLLALVLGSGFYALFSLKLTTRDRERYEKLVEKSHTFNKKNVLISLDQKRHGVMKEAWFLTEESERHIEIFADTSLLRFLKSKEKGCQIVEEMDHVICWIQELEPTTHLCKEVRYIEAEHAKYYYTTQLFVAERASMCSYTLCGSIGSEEVKLHREQVSPSLQVKASTLKFSLKGEEMHMQVNDMEADFSGEMELRKRSNTPGVKLQ